MASYLLIFLQNSELKFGQRDPNNIGIFVFFVFFSSLKYSAASVVYKYSVYQRTKIFVVKYQADSKYVEEKKKNIK